MRKLKKWGFFKIIIKGRNNVFFSFFDVFQRMRYNKRIAKINNYC